jgi:hypothetical protein
MFAFKRNLYGYAEGLSDGELWGDEKKDHGHGPGKNMKKALTPAGSSDKGKLVLRMVGLDTFG